MIWFGLLTHTETRAQSAGFYLSSQKWNFPFDRCFPFNCLFSSLLRRKFAEIWKKKSAPKNGLNSSKNISQSFSMKRFVNLVFFSSSGERKHRKPATTHQAKIVAALTWDGVYNINSVIIFLFFFYNKIARVKNMRRNDSGRDTHERLEQKIIKRLTKFTKIREKQWINFSFFFFFFVVALRRFWWNWYFSFRSDRSCFPEQKKIFCTLAVNF